MVLHQLAFAKQSQHTSFHTLQLWTFNLSLVLSTLVFCNANESIDWQSCSTFRAPSSTGYGVYAGRDFKAGEIISITPFFIDFPNTDPIIRNTVLGDYVFGYDDDSDEDVVLFGMNAGYNHHTQPNMEEYIGVLRDTGNVDAPFFRAIRNIEAGEQLFASYDPEDQGHSWFEMRGIKLQAPEKDESRIDPKVLPRLMKEWCSNIYAGMSMPSWEKRIKPHYPEDLDIPPLLPPFDAWYGDARAKKTLKRNERIEMGSGLFMSQEIVKGTALAPVVLSWGDLRTEHQQSAISVLRRADRLKVQYYGYDGESKRMNRFESWDDMSFLPLLGMIGLVRRVGAAEESNCRLSIHWPESLSAVGVGLELIATRDVEVGEVLKLNLPPTGFVEEKRLLKEELDKTKQLYFHGMFTNTNNEL